MIMLSRATRLAVGASAVASVCVSALGAGQTFTVVNMIPAAYSWEVRQNAEPNVSVNPKNTSLIVASAEVNGQQSICSKKRVAVFVSGDGGLTWQLDCIVPKRQTDTDAVDMTVRFSGDGLSLYGGVMTTSDGYYFSTKVFGLSKPKMFFGTMTPAILTAALTTGTPTPIEPRVFFSSLDIDQPYVQASPGSTDKTLIVGMDDLASWSDVAPLCASGGVIVVQDPWLLTGILSHSTCLAKRPSMGVTPAVRTAMHPDGTAYGVFYRPVGDQGGDSVDVVVVRNDAGISPATFKSLRDAPATLGAGTLAGTNVADCAQRDGEIGFRAITCRMSPVTYFDDEGFGLRRRVRADLSIAVDPANNRRVYVAWADSVLGSPSHQTIHVMRSDDGGSTWRNDLFTRGDIVNPALAVADDGAVGLLFQHLVEGRWQTWFILSTDHFATGAPTLLAETPVCPPGAHGQPYIGDYIHLEARGNNFYGVFSASNDLAASTFPQGVRTLRSYDNGKPVSDYGRVSVSIDPYFVKVDRTGPP